jgi:hypothetical protein
MIVVLGFHTSQLLLSATDFADANDLLLASYVGSLAHPPGYPLLVAMLHLLHVGLPSIPIHVIAAIFNALCMSLTSGLLFWSLVVWMKQTVGQSDRFIALIITMLWTCMPLHWLLGSVVEIMPLGFLLILCMCVCYLRQQWWGVGLFGLLAGLYHPLLFGVVMMSFVATIYRKRVNWSLLFGAGGGMAITGGLYWYLSRTTSVYSWELPQVWWQWISWWLRTVYTREGSAIEQFNTGIQLYPGIVSIYKWMSWWIITQYGWIFIVPIIWGIVFFVRRKIIQQLGWWLLLCVVYGPALAFYVKHPSSFTQSEVAIWWGVALRERMFYVFSLLLMPLSAIGLWNIGRKQVVRWVLLFGCLVFVFYRVGDGSAVHEANASEVYARKLLTSLPEQAVCIVDSDFIFQLLYLQIIQGVRQDVVLVPTGMVLQPITWHKLKGMTYLNENRIDMKRYIADIASTSLLHGRRVFIYNLDPTIMSYLGLEGNPFYAMPYGWTIEISYSPISQAPSFDYGISVQLASLKTEKADAWFKGFRTHLATIHTQHAYYYARLGYTSLAQWHQSIAKDLFYTDQSRMVVDQSVRQGAQMAEQLNSYAAYVPISTEQWLTKSLDATKKMDWDVATYYMSRAILTNMSRVDLHAQLIALYRKSGNESEALLEEQWLRAFQ